MKMMRRMRNGRSCDKEPFTADFFKLSNYFVMTVSLDCLFLPNVSVTYRRQCCRVFPSGLNFAIE
jgi:hypothetical protein